MTRDALFETVLLRMRRQ